MIINYKGSGMSSLTKSTSLDKSFYRDTYFCFVFPFCFMLFRFTTFILVKIKVFLPDTELNYIVNICSFNKKKYIYILKYISINIQGRWSYKLVREKIRYKKKLSLYRSHGCTSFPSGENTIIPRGIIPDNKATSFHLLLLFVGRKGAGQGTGFLLGHIS